LEMAVNGELHLLARAGKELIHGIWPLPMHVPMVHVGVKRSSNGNIHFSLLHSGRASGLDPIDTCILPPPITHISPYTSLYPIHIRTDKLVLLTAYLNNHAIT